MIYHAKLPTLKDKLLEQVEEEKKEERARERLATQRKGSRLKVKSRKKK